MCVRQPARPEKPNPFHSLPTDRELQTDSAALDCYLPFRYTQSADHWSSFMFNRISQKQPWKWDRAFICVGRFSAIFDFVIDPNPLEFYISLLPTIIIIIIISLLILPVEYYYDSNCTYLKMPYIFRIRNDRLLCSHFRPPYLRYRKTLEC